LLYSSKAGALLALELKKNLLAAPQTGLQGTHPMITRFKPLTTHYSEKHTSFTHLNLIPRRAIRWQFIPRRIHAYEKGGMELQICLALSTDLVILPGPQTGLQGLQRNKY
jgi:hypothetical protein